MKSRYAEIDTILEAPDDFDKDPLVDCFDAPIWSNDLYIDQEQQDESTDWFSTACTNVADELGSDLSELRSNLKMLISSDLDDSQLHETLLVMFNNRFIDTINEIVNKRRDLVDSQNLAFSNIRFQSQANLDELKRKRKDIKHQKRIMGNNYKAPHVSTIEHYEFKELLPGNTSLQNLPYVFKTKTGGNTISSFGSQYALPEGSERQSLQLYEEISVPASSKPIPKAANIPLINISKSDILCRNTFANYSTLNRIQSIVFPVAYDTNENLLICAPTGAGKTDVALLAMLHTIKDHCTVINDSAVNVDKTAFKIVYVAPLKALAAEIVDKYTRKLAWLGINVRELTGDMQLTRKELAETQVIVTTPEKWDVVTRKSTGDNNFVTKVKLLIIDEVHLLDEERGAVIESIVARTLRQVESSQSMIRMVGLSATLPNYLDVANFLRVNPQAGLFFFDASFRPVPLEQHFIGVRGKAGSRQASENTDAATFDKLTEMLKAGHQIMIFVHSRKDTTRTAREMFDRIRKGDLRSYLDCSEEVGYSFSQKEMQSAKAKELRELFRNGFGIHHAGLIRSDRNLIERMFSKGHIKVLCCTATLAWGVNLPAAAVIIRGTQVYNPSKNGYCDLPASDVIQIFGRAGRPQFESTGIAFLVTTADRLSHYIATVTQQKPIESNFANRLVDCLNAEISLGTVGSIAEGVDWLGYTYMYVRMKKNPLGYGLNWKDVSDDQGLVLRRSELISSAAKRLSEVEMISFEQDTGTLTPKNVGRIASDFYLMNTSVEIFNKLLNPDATEADVFAVVSMSGEFEQLKSREEEVEELLRLKNDVCPCEVAGTSDSPEGKANILLQAYISRAEIKEFTLMSDAYYVAQNAARLCRALFNVALLRRWGILAGVLLSVCKSIDLRVWSFETPLRQFDLPAIACSYLENNFESVSEVRIMNSKEISRHINNPKLAEKIVRYASYFPLLNIQTLAKPITSSILEIHLEIFLDFEWNERFHYKSEAFWIWVETADTSELLEVDRIILTKSFNASSDPYQLDFSIPINVSESKEVIVRATSDRWASSETVVHVPLDHLVSPTFDFYQTSSLSLRPLPLSVLQNYDLECFYAEQFQYFNPMLTQTFHSIYHTDSNLFIGVPSNSGIELAYELATLKAIRESPDRKVCFILPSKEAAAAMMHTYSGRLSRLGIETVAEFNQAPGILLRIEGAEIIFFTAPSFEAITRSAKFSAFCENVSLIIIDSLHMVASDNSHVEKIVTRIKALDDNVRKAVRVFGSAVTVSNAFDFGCWLECTYSGIYNFSQSIKTQRTGTHVEGFPDNLNGSKLMKVMNKPVFTSIKHLSPREPVIVFVNSRRQLRLTAMDLTNFCAIEDNPKRFLTISDDELDAILNKIRDPILRFTLQFGIGTWHSGMVESDRNISEQLYHSGSIQILVSTKYAPPSADLTSKLVIIKGSDFYDSSHEGSSEVITDDGSQIPDSIYALHGYSSDNVVIFTKESKKEFYESFMRSGFPIESKLLDTLTDFIGAQVANGSVQNRTEAVRLISGTFLYRRIYSNPSYYGAFSSVKADIDSWLTNVIDTACDELDRSGCLNDYDPTSAILAGTKFLNIACFYNVSHSSLRHILENVQQDSSSADIVKLITTSAEFRNIPCTHTDAAYLQSVINRLGLTTEYGECFGQIYQMKAIVLIEAYRQHIHHSFADMVADCRQILEKALRLSDCIIDIAAEKGYLNTMLQTIRFIHSVKQRYPDGTDPIYGLPGVNKNARPAKLSSIYDLCGYNTKQAQQAMRELQVAPKFASAFIQTVTHLPFGKLEVKRTRRGIDITFHKDVKTTDKGFNLYTCNYHGPLREQWIGIVCSEDLGTVFALKRVSCEGNELKFHIDWTAAVKDKAHFMLINDAIGVQYSRDI
ncbi:hypothetical protein CANCADRAFT_30350 [Tortispora caseinolytica NRRL Y-17796]|uniref:Uncharacterized protein n=1 Tax=Tortispora caseinolytica NRRL Y-17796 TaxID=767744 RepID=A0A1E4TK99_9ASCO|nr:hypothetical protein CANCADRAFT_30350 [Tortispora caseinolytica NRRL Y-17796]